MSDKAVMISVRLSASEAQKIRAAAKLSGLSVSEFVRVSLKPHLPQEPLDIETWNVPPGFAGPTGIHHRCRKCGVITVGPRDPKLTMHIGGCSELKKIKEML